MGLIKEDWDLLDSLLDKASRDNLDEVSARVNHEVMVSDIAIGEGAETRGD